MSKRSRFLATLIAVVAVFVLVGQALAAVEYRYQPSPNLQCNGSQPWETMRAQLNNSSGQTIHIRRWFEIGGVKTFVDATSQPLSNGTSNAESYKRRWPTNLVAIGWDVDESVSGVSISNEANFCGF